MYNEHVNKKGNHKKITGGCEHNIRLRVTSTCLKIIENNDHNIESSFLQSTAD